MCCTLIYCIREEWEVERKLGQGGFGQVFLVVRREGQGGREGGQGGREGGQQCAAKCVRWGEGKKGAMNFSLRCQSSLAVPMSDTDKIRIILHTGEH